MGLMDMVSGALGGAAAGRSNPMLDSVTQMLSNDSAQGGLAGLVRSFQERGLGEQVASWIGDGDNQPVSAEQIKDVIGEGEVHRIAEKLGVDDEQAAGGLADLLPQAVDKLTPGGGLPQGDLMDQGLALLRNKLFG